MSCRLAALVPKTNMSRRKLEITVLSCEGLRIDGRPVRKNTFVVVRTDPINARSTCVDLEGGGSHPCWNEKLSLEIPMHERVVTLEVHYCKTPGRRGSNVTRVVGSARMPVSDFMGGYLPDNYLSFLSYRLRDVKGERNGIVNVSVKVEPLSYSLASSSKLGRSKDRSEYIGEKGYKNIVDERMLASSSGSRPVMAVPMGAGDNFNNGVVTGIPVNWCVNNHEHYSRF